TVRMKVTFCTGPSFQSRPSAWTTVASEPNDRKTPAAQRIRPIRFMRFLPRSAYELLCCGRLTPRGGSGRYAAELKTTSASNGLAQRFGDSGQAGDTSQLRQRLQPVAMVLCSGLAP